MNNPLLRAFFSGMAGCVMLLAGSSASAADISACTPGGIAFGFFNGVQTNPKQAQDALIYLRAEYGARTEKGEHIAYETFYNYSNGIEDFVETFEQRLKEQDGVLINRFELFDEAILGGGSMFDTIKREIPSIGSILTGAVDNFTAYAIKTLAALKDHPPSTSNYVEHQGRITGLALEGKKMLFFAHSQGNLFANQAYEYALTKVDAKSVAVVHAAPASPLLSGEHTLANLDVVINGLRAVGTVASITDTIPGYLVRPAGANGLTDILGHGLLEIYLNTDLAPRARLKNQVMSAFSTLVAPSVTAVSGFITATMTWDGAGDVDLHVVEPDGSHVFYQNKVGNAGYLDVDNTVEFGPEHYYASCDPAKLQVGTYQFQIANFARAQGRHVTLQIASSYDGVLGTFKAVMGPETGSVPAGRLTSVVVTKDADTGVFRASIPSTPG